MADAVPEESRAGAIRDVVVLRLPAVGAYLSVLRTAVAGLAARLDFTLDEIEDLRIAVDEACAMVLPTAIPGANLECEFELSKDLIRVSVSVLTLDGRQPERDTFAWTVLSALAGEVDSRVDADLRVTIDLQKRRAATSPVDTDAAGQRAGTAPVGDPPRHDPPSARRKAGAPDPDSGGTTQDPTTPGASSAETSADATRAVEAT